MAGYNCPFCNHVMALNDSTSKVWTPNFDDGIWYNKDNIPKELIAISFFKCPNCNKITINARGLGKDVKDIFIPIYPNSHAKQFPNYIPQAILDDYEEACAIVNLSPKASATLSRRCLQGMIRDFWDVKKSRLVDEIEALKEKIHPTQWKVIDGVRRIGNIGAHMEKDINLIIDIEPDEAIKLIKLIELLLFSWYIKRHEEESLYNDIIELDTTTQLARTSKE